MERKDILMPHYEKTKTKVGQSCGTWDHSEDNQLCLYVQIWGGAGCFFVFRDESEDSKERCRRATRGNSWDTYETLRADAKHPSLSFVTSSPTQTDENNIVEMQTNYIPEDSTTLISPTETSRHKASKDHLRASAEPQTSFMISVFTSPLRPPYNDQHDSVTRSWNVLHQNILME